MPLISEEDFKEASKRQYNAYRVACRFEIHIWRFMFPNQEKYQIGVPGVFWQARLWDVDIGRVWKHLGILHTGILVFPLRVVSGTVYSVCVDVVVLVGA